MSTLYIDHKNIELRADGGCLGVYHDQQRTGSIPLGQIERLITFCNTRLDTRVLATLAENKVGFAAINLRNSQRSVILPGYQHNDVLRRLAQYQAVNDEKQCTQWAQLLVTHKLKNQIKFIRQLLAARPDKRYPLQKAHLSLQQQLNGMVTEPASNLEKLRGIEGAAAATYFKALAHIFAPALQFQGRNRRPPKDPVNACLSLGYTLMHSDAVIACQQAGLDPMLGFYHRPAFARDSLASDIIEPARPYIDTWVWQLFRAKKLGKSHFYENKGACLLGKTGRKIFYSEYEQQAHKHRRLLKQITQTLIRQMPSSSDERD